MYCAQRNLPQFSLSFSVRPAFSWKWRWTLSVDDMMYAVPQEYAPEIRKQRPFLKGFLAIEPVGIPCYLQHPPSSGSCSLDDATLAAQEHHPGSILVNIMGSA